MYRNCIKNDKKYKFFDKSCQFEAFFFYKLNLYRNESSPKHQSCPCLRNFNTLVHEVYRYFDKKRAKLVIIGNVSKFCLFRCQCSKQSEQHIRSLLTLFIVPIYKVRQKFGKKHALNLWKILGFLSFSVSI